MSDDPRMQQLIAEHAPVYLNVDISAPAAPAVPPPPPPRARAAPTTAAEARVRIAEFTNNNELGARLLRGDVAANREFQDASAFVANNPDDEVDLVMSGQMPGLSSGVIPDSRLRLMEEVTADLRELGISEGVIRELLTGRKLSAAEHALVTNWKRDRMGDPTWVKRFLAGEREAKRLMTTADIALNGNIAEF